MLAHHTAVRSMFLIASHYGTHMRPEQLAGVDIADPLGSVLRILSQCGFKCRTLRGRGWKDMAALGSAYPVMAVQKTGNWVIVACITSDQGAEVAAVVDPSAEQAGMILVPRAEFLATWSGTLVLCKRRRRVLEPAPRFGLRWFMPEILRHRRYFRDVTIAALASNIIGLSTPLMYNVIIDKVISHQSYQTLLTVVLMFLAATAFDGVFTYVRQRMMLFATNKIDANLASRTFARLLSLPLTFFEHTTAGVLTRHMQQTEKLRHFLTGRLFQTMLDTATLPILIVLLAIYSVKLTLVVLACALAMAGVIAGLIPTFRACLNRLYQAEGDRQGHLVETIHGMRTIKSLGMETLRQDAWDLKIVNSVRRQAVVGKIGILGSVLTGVIEKIMQIAVLGLGTLDVFNGNMSVGSLVAFTMLSGRMSGPLVQIVALINEFQETALSVKMLGIVMDHPPERDPGHHSIRAAITGELEFDQVTFRHPGSSTPALDRVSFRVAEGQVVGVVGRSGSGKTTLTRLMQGIQTAQEGAVRLSGIDIRHIDLGHLRHEVGIVLQDSFLFRGTIRDNIAATRPDISLAEIVAAARTAGAEEFIDRLPLSYETMIEEGATNLSGGQRQRIAIARALLAQPRLLIFDEATSALDPESEGILQENLKDIARNRTMVIVSHRLSSLVQSDAILVLERGHAVDFAPHDVLVERCPIYRNLWNQQTQHIRA